MKVKFKRLITLLLVCILMLMGCGKAKEDEVKLEVAKLEEAKEIYRHRNRIEKVI